MEGRDWEEEHEQGDGKSEGEMRRFIGPDGHIDSDMLTLQP